MIASSAESLPMFRGELMQALLAAGAEVSVPVPGAFEVRPSFGGLGVGEFSYMSSIFSEQVRSPFLTFCSYSHLSCCSGEAAPI